tara:strand:- start:7210 stop:8274 length:1065 start_codon:yes stop_codon:yes gene_type:complete
MRRFTNFFTLTLAIIMTLSIQAHAQNEEKQQQEEKTYKLNIRAVDEVTALNNKTIIKLWGIESSGISDPTLKLKARVNLDNIIGNETVSCTLKNRTAEMAVAQCVNKDDIDLGLHMLQNGFAIVNRSEIYGTVFEQPYIQAEQMAQNKETGIWNKEKTQEGSSSRLMLTVSFILLIFIVIAFIALSIFIMRGFQKVIEAQNLHMDMAAKERALKEQERKIFASMMDSEIKANKSKIEAYIMVYEELLNALKDTEKSPKYKSTGDIVQKQPALSRAVFDRNTDKLDFLGNQLSSEIIHFYARIKTNAEYENLEPSMELSDAIKLVEKAVNNAHRLDQISDRLIDNFEEAGLASSV